jgi:hypothetical protein
MRHLMLVLQDSAVLRWTATAATLAATDGCFCCLQLPPLQKLADIWAYPDYINAAAAAQDPLERMKLLVAWMVAGVYILPSVLALHV